jgi:N-acetylneuraminate synthase
MIITEIGLNHLGSETIAFEMLERLLKSDIDAITFQIREKPFYDRSRPHRISLSNAFYEKAIILCKQGNKKVGIAIADIDLIDFINDQEIDFWKTLSWDILNYDLQNKLQETKKIVFISTGVSDIDEIREANQHFLNCRFIHTQLTHNIHEANLKAIQFIKQSTGKEVAFGLHCTNRNVLFACLGFEPSDIFFYIKPNSTNKFPDDSHAILLDELSILLSEIRLVQTAIGDGNKKKMVKNL